MDFRATTFVAADVALLRMPTAPAALAASTRVDLSGDVELTGFLRGVLADPLLREAVEVGSDALADTLRRIDDGRPVEPARLRRAAYATARYVLRTAGRPTPFGLFAGVALASFDSDAKVRLGDQHRKGVRPDAGWLISLVRRLELRPEVRRHLRLTANDLCVLRGDRLVLPYVRRDADAGGEERSAAMELSVRHTPSVRQAIELSRFPVSGTALAEGLGVAFPRASGAAVESMLGRLVEQEILLTDLRPPASVADPLGHVLDRLAGVADLPEMDALADIAAALRQYAAQPVGAGRASLRQTVSLMRALQPCPAPPVQVDLRLDAEVRIPRAVAEEAVRAAHVLWRLAPDPADPEYLRQYHSAFLERYGSQRLVPLRDLLDPERGLGAPAGYEVPASERVHSAGQPVSQRDRSLATLAELALLDGSGEVVLDDDLVDRVAPAHASELPPPDGIELCVQVFAASVQAMDMGDFRLVASPAVGSPTAGALVGRFAHLFADGQQLTALAVGTGRGPRAPGRDVGGDPLRVQLTFQPLHSRVANVLQVPTVHEHTLAVGTFADRAAPTVLGVGDVAVFADRERLYLYSIRHDRRIVAVLPHRLNITSYAANAVRLIREITASGFRGPEGWWWGEAAILPHLPRVRYGRTVLSLARWQPGRQLADTALSWRDWERELATWRERWRVPDRVLAGAEDNRLALDLTVPLHRRLFREELRRRPETNVTEVPGSEAELGWLNGYANEVVVSMAAVAPAPTLVAPAVAPPVAPPVHPAAALRHLPGGRWLYAKLYCARARQDELLAEHLAPFADGALSDVDRWFFVRYADPEPHLRLRYHGEPAALYGELLPRLHDWASELCAVGLANRMVLDTYDPEITRYGGPAVLAAAEEAFAADSVASLVQLRLRGRGLLDVPADLLAALNYVDLLRAFGEPDWCDWLLGQYPRAGQHSAFRSMRREAIRIVDLSGDWAALGALDGGTDLLAAWRRRAPALAAYASALRHRDGGVAPWRPDGGSAPIRDTVLPALLHMHHNRLVGIDPDAESRSIAIARGVVEAAANRKRFEA
jgi:thiopeptide-type bacteriocin biosynthesis protein